MRKTLNRETIIGRVYDHQLEMKKVQNQESANYGKDFIGGSIDIATDDECLNIVTVHFTYVTPTYKSGKVNNSYNNLKSLIERGRTIINDGKVDADIVKIDASLGLNDFYVNRNGEDTLISAKRNIGGFVNILAALPQKESERNTFECDVLINGTQYVEANEENGIKEDYLIVKGAVFDFRQSIMPVDFIVKNKGGIQYFESLDASSKNLVFTKVWGNINSETKVTKVEEESAFGEAAVKEYTKSIKEWVITGTSKPELMYDIGDETAGITAEEIKKALADREIYLAEVKRRAEEYQATKNNVSATAPAASGGFNF